MMKNPMKKPAFTMVELIFVIIVLGILAALALPRMSRDTHQEAADNVLSAIRYTQHLALMDNKTDPTEQRWQQRFWHLTFSTCSGGGVYYMIGSDIDTKNSTNAIFDKTEAAMDPHSNKPYFWSDFYTCPNGGDGTVSEDIFLTKKYGVTSVASSGGCNGAMHIAFDHLGRTYHGKNFSQSNTPDFRGYVNSTCRFKFTFNDGATFSIDIASETGYAHIVDQNGS